MRLAAKAAAVAGTPLTISVDRDDTRKAEFAVLGHRIEEQNLWEFISAMSAYERIRTLSADIPAEIYKAAAGLNKYIATAPVVTVGRVELLHYLKEQSIAYEYHRYGSIAEVPTI